MRGLCYLLGMLLEQLAEDGGVWALDAGEVSTVTPDFSGRIVSVTESPSL